MTIKKILFLFVFCLSLIAVQCWAGPIPGWPAFYDGFEARTVDVQLDDETTGPLDSTATGAYATFETVDTTCYVRDDLTARYGTKYIHLKAQWTDPSDCGPTIGYGNNGFKRSFFVLTGSELAENILLDVDNGTEYWIGWSQYIPADEKTQRQLSGAFQANTNNGANLSTITYWGGEGTGYNKFAMKRADGTYPASNWIYPNLYWEDYKGQWVDWVLQVRFYTTDNASAKMNYYINGVNYTAAWDGHKNTPPTATGAYLGWQLYNFWNCGDAADANCTDVAEDYYGCDNTGEWENWSRNYVLDEIRVNEYQTGQGNHYAAVAPPIWAATPSITYPTEGLDTVDSTSFTSTFSAYADQRSDPMGAFSAYHTQIEVDEAGGNWSTPVYSATVSSASSRLITGLNAATAYQIRVRHSSYNYARSVEYYGDWSTAVSFTTEGILTSGTVFTQTSGNITEAGIIAGGATIILTLGGTTWNAFNDTICAAIVANMDSDRSDATGWDALIKADPGGWSATGVIRTSDTICTITLPTSATYDITENETIITTVPASAVASSEAMQASPNVLISADITASSGTGFLGGYHANGAAATYNANGYIRYVTVNGNARLF